MQDIIGMGQILIGLENLPSVLSLQLKVADGLDTLEIEIGSEERLFIETSKIWIAVSTD